MDDMEDNVYLECQHRNSTGTLDHRETLGSELKDKYLRLDGKGFPIYVPGTCVVGCCPFPLFNVRTSRDLLCASFLRSIPNLGGDFDSLT